MIPDDATRIDMHLQPTASDVRVITAYADSPQLPIFNPAQKKGRTHKARPFPLYICVPLNSYTLSATPQTAMVNTFVILLT